MKIIVSKNLNTHIFIIVFALLFVYIGNKVASSELAVDLLSDENETVNAVVTNVIDISLNEENWWSQTTISFEARITKGERKNEIVAATQSYSSFLTAEPVNVTKGARILLVYNDALPDFSGEWHYLDHVRINKLIALGAVFAVLLVIFGRVKGINTILSLGFTCIAIFAVFIPSILSGKNIYVSSIIICIYTIVVTLFILNGINKKSITAVIGCFGGVLAAACITLLMNGILNLTGWLNNESTYLVNLPIERPIDLIAIIFAGIIIGALGAVMDVAVSISSALWELKEEIEGISFKTLFRSGLNIGKDIMGSMANTLVLAYIGSSLTVILVLIVYSSSVSDLINREMLTVEILQALVGSLGILLTMPLTAIISAALYTSHGLDRDSKNTV